MSGLQSHQVTLAMRLVRERGYTITAAAKRHGVGISSVRRALRLAGVPPGRPGRRPKVAAG